MKVSCQACGAKYTIADDKVRGRKVKIRCKSCGTPMVVDGQSEAPAAAGAVPGGGAAGAVGVSVSWSVNLSDTDQRTMTTDEIVTAWKKGEVTNDAFVWKDGMGDWVPILDSAELKPLLAGAPATGAGLTPFGPTVVTATAVAAATSARLAGGGRGAAVDLFDAAAASPSEEDEVATSAPALPTAGSTAYDDGKMTGARNENSVLFSLDSLKGGMTAEPKKAPAPARKTAPAALGGDPFAMSPAEIGGGNAIFSLNANQALLTAPAAPEPPPPRVDASGAVVAQPMNKLVVYGGGGAAAVILLLLGLLLGRSGGKEAPAPDGSAKEEPAASASADTEKKTEPKADEKPAETASATASAAGSATASAPSASASAKSTAAPTATATKVASTSKSSSSTKETKSSQSKPAEETMPSVGSAPFSVSAAQVALTQAATNAGSCAKAAGPTGSGKVQVTFATSGRVTTATVMAPPFAGTPVGGCVAGVFRKARIPAYSGNPVTVSKSFNIH
jgi:predicted Zn finger-like uncharacterized protein